MVVIGTRSRVGGRAKVKLRFMPVLPRSFPDDVDRALVGPSRAQNDPGSAPVDWKRAKMMTLHGALPGSTVIQSSSSGALPAFTGPLLAFTRVYRSSSGYIIPRTIPVLCWQSYSTSLSVTPVVPSRAKDEAGKAIVYFPEAPVPSGGRAPRSIGGRMPDVPGSSRKLRMYACCSRTNYFNKIYLFVIQHHVFLYYWGLTHYFMSILWKMAVFIEKSPVTSSNCYNTIKTASKLLNGLR
jgi:hypothetical protein